MPAQILDGRATAKSLQGEIAQRVETFVESTGVKPTLAAVLCGDDPASAVYVRNKERACGRVGMNSQLHRLDARTSTEQLVEKIENLNADPSVHGILVQLPLPSQIDDQRVLDLVDPIKDVDAFHPENVGLLSQGRPRFLPCTPHGVLQILSRYGLSISGRHAVIVGRSDIVGKPLAMLMGAKETHLGKEIANATVTVCHSRTTQLARFTREAEILVAAIGRANLITPDMVRPDAIVIDVGINRTDAGLVGDVDFEGVRQVASHITPVPGGIGPLTVAMLLDNTLKAAQLQRQRSRSG